ncbi:MAG TPA: hypothetical protein VLK34_07045 [Nocardioidaceae bacterium]|nr:hypothetical protein [Nocardioidaceae bacterium]
MGILGSAGDVLAGGRRSGRRRALRVVFAASAVVALSGCAANFNAPTNDPYQPAAGISDRTGDIYSLNTLVVTDGSGNGTVVASLVNQATTDDTLDSFSATDSTGAAITAEPLAQPIDLPAYPSPDQAVALGTAGGLRLTGDNLVAGTFVNITFNFGNAAPLTVNVPVIPGGPDTIYADIPVGPVSSAAATG